MVSEHASPLAVLGGEDAGGQNVHVAALSVELGRLGHEVDIYTRRDDPTLPPVVRLADGVRVVHVDAGPPWPVPKDELPPFMPRFAVELRRAWAAQPPDVAHAHFWMSGIATLDAARDLRIPVVQTFHALGVVKRRHQGAADTSPACRIEEERRLARSADLVVATCTDEVFELVRQGADPRRVRVVPCGVDLDLFRPDGPREDRTPGLARAVVVTRLVARKGVGNAIEGLAAVDGVELVVAGGPDLTRIDSDPEARRLRAIARDAGVAGRVHFRGAVGRDAVPALLRSADACLCVPWYEPFGIVPLEAMACGVPVIASAVGGLIDTVVDGVTGLHVPPRSPERIGEALRELVAAPALRAELGRAGAARARRRYGWQRVAARTLEAYETVARVRPAIERRAAL
jgi:glycosyltransferase involved in cell wall biosynthesis